MPLPPKDYDLVPDSGAKHLLLIFDKNMCLTILLNGSMLKLVLIEFTASAKVIQVIKVDFMFRYRFHDD